MQSTSNHLTKNNKLTKESHHLIADPPEMQEQLQDWKWSRDMAEKVATSISIKNNKTNMANAQKSEKTFATTLEYCRSIVKVPEWAAPGPPEHKLLAAETSIGPRLKASNAANKDIYHVSKYVP